MKSKLSVMVAAVALAVFVLAGCSAEAGASASGSGAATRSGSSAVAESGSSASSAAEVAQVAYALESMTTYTEVTAFGNEVIYELNERGDVMTATLPNGRLEYTRDEAGWPTSQTTYDATGTLVAKMTVENTADATGRVTESVATRESDGSVTVTTYEYYVDGAVKSIVSESPTGGTVEEFDEGGYRTRYAMTTAQGTAEMTFAWEKDDRGYATARVGTIVAGSAIAPLNTVVETDDAGNITAYRDTDTDTLVQEAQWASISTPSLYTSLFGTLHR